MEAAGIAGGGDDAAGARRGEGEADPRVVSGARAVEMLADALRDVAGIEVAFVFGSTAAGPSRPDSDIDVVVVAAPHLDRRALYRQCVEVAFALGHEVNTLTYTREALAERIRDPSHPAHPFVRRVLAGPTRRLAGRDDALAWLERRRDAAGRR